MAVQVTVAFGASVVAAGPQLNAVPSGFPTWSSLTVNWVGPRVTLPPFVIV